MSRLLFYPTGRGNLRTPSNPHCLLSMLDATYYIVPTACPTQFAHFVLRGGRIRFLVAEDFCARYCTLRKWNFSMNLLYKQKTHGQRTSQTSYLLNCYTGELNVVSAANVPSSIVADTCKPRCFYVTGTPVGVLFVFIT